MRLIDYTRPMPHLNITNTIPRHDNAVSTKMPAKTNMSQTKDRVFPHRYTDKHVWLSYGYNSTYSDSFDEPRKQPLLIQKPRANKPSPRTPTESAPALIGKIYKSNNTHITTHLSIKKQFEASKKASGDWNNPHNYKKYIEKH